MAILTTDATIIHRTTSGMVESFMSSGSRLVGDPFLFKWIVVPALSISLNGYLLKVIGAGLAKNGPAPKSDGVRFTSEGKVAETHEVAIEPAAPTPRPRLTVTFTLDDVDKILNARNSTVPSRPTSHLIDSSTSDSDKFQPTTLSDPLRSPSPALSHVISGASKYTPHTLPGRGAAKDKAPNKDEKPEYEGKMDIESASHYGSGSMKYLDLGNRKALILWSEAEHAHQDLPSWFWQ
ncbi:hypothetical protein IW262DRAFT_1291024 [Armillaria fumosa]|nr:hypothetical protein IW262DRAFT_1291024 [Armillaria fumosa]